MRIYFNSCSGRLACPSLCFSHASSKNKLAIVSVYVCVRVDALARDALSKSNVCHISRSSQCTNLLILPLSCSVTLSITRSQAFAWQWSGNARASNWNNLHIKGYIMVLFKWRRRMLDWRESVATVRTSICAMHPMQKRWLIKHSHLLNLENVWK